MLLMLGLRIHMTRFDPGGSIELPPVADNERSLEQSDALHRAALSRPSPARRPEVGGVGVQWEGVSGVS